MVFGALGRSRIVDYAGIDNDWTISLGSSTTLSVS